MPGRFSTSGPASDRGAATLIAVSTPSTIARSGRVVVGVAAVVAAVDWGTKALATAALENAPLEIGSLITLRLSHNPGVAFGVGDRLPGPALIALTATVTAVLAVAAIRGVFPSRVVAGLVLGGAVANLVDRVIGGTVVDFLDLSWWPSFYLADVALSVGCGLLILQSLRTERVQPA
jgi:signal peptidase II